MPDLNNLAKTQLVSSHWLSKNITERQHWEEEWQPRKKQYTAISAIKDLERLAFSDSLTTLEKRRSLELCIEQE